MVTKLAQKAKKKGKKTLDEVICDRTCTRVTRMANFTQKFDLLKNELDNDTMSSLVSQVHGYQLEMKERRI